jgi:serine/threonine protein kinase
MSASDRFRDGQSFGRYQIVRLIGEGGMGAVYEAIHPALKRPFAIKTLLPEFAQKEDSRGRFPAQTVAVVGLVAAAVGARVAGYLLVSDHQNDPEKVALASKRSGLRCLPTGSLCASCRGVF